MSQKIPLNQLTLFPEDSPVNPSQSQAKEEEQTMTAISGMKLLESCPFTNPDGLLAKMWKELLTSKTAWSSDRCKMTWKKKVSKSNVVLFQLQASVLGIKERESGFWATPNTMDHLPPRSKEGTLKLQQGHRKGRTRPSNLREQVDPQTMAMYPTPTTQEIEHPDMVLNERGRRMPKKGKTDHSLNLADTVRMMYPTPTPACEEGGQQSHRVERTKSGGFILRKKNKTNQTYGAKLSDAMLYLENKKMYPTPRTGAGSRPNGKGGKVLEEEVMIEAGLRERGKTLKQMYPTPVAKDNCTESLETWEKRAEKHKERGKTIPKALRIQVQEENKKIYNTPTTNDHKNTSFPKSQKNRHSIVGNLMQQKNPPKVGGRLNPQFVQFLMGYPMNWTKIE